MKMFLINKFFAKGSTFERFLERLAVLISPSFDSKKYYLARPDVLRGDLSAAAHFLIFGSREGVSPIAEIVAVPMRWRSKGGNESWVALVVHDFSPTGAPIVALDLAQEIANSRNLWVIGLRSGELREHFAKISNKLTVFSDGTYAQAEISYGLSNLRIETLIFNSVESLALFDSKKIKAQKLIALIHEFAYYTPNIESRVDNLLRFDMVVFSTELTRDSFRRAGLKAAAKKIIVMRQPLANLKALGVMSSDTAKQIRRKRKQNVILGAGFVQSRKGVDLFIEVCRKINEARPGMFKFEWMGAGFSPSDTTLGAYLQEQVRVSGLEPFFRFVPHGDLAEALENCFCFLSTSRSDPFPNVVLDSLAAGVPTFCFADVNGASELLREMGFGHWVIPFSDLSEMANRVLEQIDGDATDSEFIKEKLLASIPNRAEYIRRILSPK